MKSRRRHDALLKMWLLGRLSNDAKNLVRDKPTAYQMMEALKKDFDSRTISSQMKSLKELLAIRYQPGEQAMERFCSSVNQGVNNLKKFGELNFEVIHKVILYMGIAEVPKYDSLVTVLMSNDATTVDQITAAYLDKAANGQREKGNVKPVAFATQVEKQTRNDAKKDLSQLKCYRCNQMGHMARNCQAKVIQEKKTYYPKKGDKGATSHASDDSSGKKGIANFTFMASGAKMDRDEWVEDSCASELFTNRRDVFHTFQTTEGAVQVGNTEYLPVTGTGLVKFWSTCSDGSVKSIAFSNFKLSEGLVGNLMSMGRLDEKGISSSSQGGEKKYYFEGEEVMCAKLVNGKWVLQLEVILPETTSAAMAATSTSKISLWHERMCHLGHNNLKKLASMDSSVHVGDGNTQEKCGHCIEANMTRRPFVRSNKPRSKYPLQLVHMDFVIINTEGRDGELAAMILTDDATLCRFSFPLRRRRGSDVLATFSTWLSWAERQTGRKLKAIHPDNAKEFVQGVFAEKMKELGVHLQPGVAYEHEQNGSAEISNRILLNKARSILMRACGDRGKEYWPDALMCATFAANRSPTVASSSMTPIEMFTGQKPDLSVMRIFGSKVWARFPAEFLKGSNKLNRRARACRMLGYAAQGHAYLLLDETTHEVFQATNVQFDETDVYLPSLEAREPDQEHRVQWDEVLETEIVGGSPHSATRGSRVSQFETPSASSGSQRVVATEGEDEVEINSGESDSSDERGNESDGFLQEPENFLRRLIQDEEVDEEEPIPSPTVNMRRGQRERRPPGEYWKVQKKPGAMFAFAALSLDPVEVQKARQREISTLEDKGVWELTVLPEGRKAVPSFFVDGRKKSDDGKEMGVYKSRLVLDGSKTVKGIDYEETFSPTIKINTLRIFLATINHMDMEAEQADFKAAYVNAKMDREVYMRQPPGFAKYPEHLKGKGLIVCKLVKALYGGNNSGRLWNIDLDRWIKQQGFTRSEFDYCLYSRGRIEDKSFILLSLWTDDIIGGYFKENFKGFNHFMLAMGAKFEMSKRGELKSYVSIDIMRDRDKCHMILSQVHAVKEMVKEFGLQHVKNRAVPVIPGFAIEGESDEEVTNMPYRSIVGGINFVNNFSRPDLSFAVSTLSRYNNEPRESQVKALVNCMKYLAGSVNLQLRYKAGINVLRRHYAYCDAGFYTDKRSGASQIGYCTFLENDVIHWKSKLPRLAATSTTMAELLAAFYCAQHVVWEDEFYKSLGFTEGVPVIYTDSEPLFKILATEKHLDRTKHEVTKIQWLRGLVRAQKIKFEKCTSGANKADMFTKALGRNAFMQGVTELGMIEI